MAEGRLVRRDEVEELLTVWERSGERMSDWCAARGLNWYSLNAFKGRWSGPTTAEIAFAEVVSNSVQSGPVVYRVLVGELAIEVEDDFEDDTLVRLVRAVARC
jgi:hypothetical protein